MKKYKLPWTHDCAQNSTIEDLIVEYYEDYFEEFPDELRKEVSVDGEYYFDGTEDPLLDKWEDEFRRGITPDLEEGLSQEERAKLQKERELSKRARKTAANFEEIDEVYDDYQRMQKHPKYKSKTVVAGSKEDSELRQKSSLNKILGSGSVPDSGEIWEDLLGTD